MLIFHYTCSKSHLWQVSRGHPVMRSCKNNKQMLIYFISFLWFYLNNLIFRLGSFGSTFGGSQGGAIISSGGSKCWYFNICRAKRLPRRVEMLLFHYTYSKSHLWRVNIQGARVPRLIHTSGGEVFSGKCGQEEVPTACVLECAQARTK